MTAEDDIRFEPMRETDIDWVAGQEKLLHPYPWNETHFREALGAAYSSWMLRQNDNPLGYALLMVAPGEATLLNISIAMNAQRRGMGTRFLNFLLDQAALQGAESVILEVRPSNTAAIELYRRFGFAEIGLRKGYYRLGQLREDALVMKKALS